MRRPMSKLERSLLFPQDTSQMSDELAEELRHDRCPKCGRLRHYGGRYDEKCICPKPEPVPEKKEFKPYIPIGQLKCDTPDLENLGRIQGHTEDERLRDGFRLMGMR